MTDQTERPELIWAGDAKLGSPGDKYWWPNDDTGVVEYIRKDISDARIAELESNINIKADWIEATINDMAAQEQELHEMKARAEAAEAKLAKAGRHLAELLQVQDGVPMTGMEATKRAENARTTLAELKGPEA